MYTYFVILGKIYFKNTLYRKEKVVTRQEKNKIHNLICTYSDYNVKMNEIGKKKGQVVTMSKFLKVIVNLFLVFAILVAGAILVPPIIGVSTTMIDSASMDTNLPVGSITYSQNESVTNIVAGDTLLIERDNRVYVYVVESADAVTGKFVVVDEVGDQTEPEEITLRNEALKVVLTVPLIGYIMVAMHSVEGLIIIGLVVLFVIILFILSELWKKSDEDDEEDNEEEDFREELLGDDTAAKEADLTDTQMSEGLELFEEESVQTDVPEETEKIEISEEMEEAAGESVSDELAQSVEEAVESEEVSDEQALEEESEEPDVQEDAVEEEPEQENTFVKVPRQTLEEILKKAENTGDKPEVIPYDSFGITVVDFTKCI